MNGAQTTWRGDLAVAAALGIALATAWTLRDWATLSTLRLPDTDDVMRLQQVRDWLGGQAFADVSQHRLGLGNGLPMHWSRLADLGPAALIATLSPLAGRHIAELAAVLIWPTSLFVAALALVARIVRALGSGASARTAIVVAALAYPTTTVFAPGRIDHHGAQIVLLLGALLAMLGKPTARAGCAAGSCAAASLVIGLETAPLLAILAGWAAIDLIRDRNDRRLLGFGTGLAAGLLVGRAIFAPRAWSYPACDGFTADAWIVALLGAAGMIAAALAGRAITARLRPATVLATGGVSLILALAASPRCLSPYGAVDPRLAALWLAKVQEAQPLFGADAASAIGYAGLAIVGLAATSWRLHRKRTRGWALLLAVQVVAVAVMTVQLRGAYAAAILAAPALATLVTNARARGIGALAAAWIAAAGIAYPLAAKPLAPPLPPSKGGGDCTSPALLTALDALPPGRVIAPIDTGAWMIGATRQHPLAAPYHRNNDGNLAMYRFYLGSPSVGATILARDHVDYVVACADMPGGWRVLPGLRPIAHTADGSVIYTR